MNLLIIIIGVFLIIVGALVWYFKLLEITPGFNGKKVKNRNGMAKWVGINYILMGCGFIVSSLITYYLQMDDIIVVIIFTALLYIFIFFIYLGYKKYSSS